MVGLTSGVSVRREGQVPTRRRVKEPSHDRGRGDSAKDDVAEWPQWPKGTRSSTSRRGGDAQQSTFTTDALCLNEGALAEPGASISRGRTSRLLDGVHNGWGSRSDDPRGPIAKGLYGRSQWAWAREQDAGSSQWAWAREQDAGSWAGWERERIKDHHCCPGTEGATLDDQPPRCASHLQQTEPEPEPAEAGPGDVRNIRLGGGNPANSANSASRANVPAPADPSQSRAAQSAARAPIPAASNSFASSSLLASSSCPFASDMPGGRQCPSGGVPERVSHVAVESDFFAPPPPAYTTQPPLPLATQHTTSSSLDTKGTSTAPSSPRLDSKLSNISEIEKGLYKSLSKHDWIDSDQNSVTNSIDHSYRALFRKNVLDPVLTFLSPKFKDKEIEQKFRREVSGIHDLLISSCLRTFAYTTFRRWLHPLLGLLTPRNGS